ncbi:gremlin-1-like [Hydractinia symbiolongicarpus]|uniref:gremlin-1-like n=1 Tax=Hydractinia symbiolongicarpus TaxID=13093 RepID=UPI00254F0562|nr:gremlin-1-like [Hydractinia symbiolongicarpus]XP_057303862.1 gremlin-1-like [Hydractinia symbiolongicarpus]
MGGKQAALIIVIAYIYCVIPGPLKEKNEDSSLPSEKDLMTSRDCLTIPFEMNVTASGCYNKTIPNNFCQGLCTSIVASNFTRETELEVCNACGPEVQYERVVFLKCPKTVGGETLEVLKPIEVTMVQRCKCLQCTQKEDQK